MKVELLAVTVRALTAGYQDDPNTGVVGYSGKLDIRPAYQREFIYKDKQRDAVITTVMKRFPLNVMYWAVRDVGSFEVVDGQQRTISICQYVSGAFSLDGLFFHNLTADKQELILDYPLMVYLCSGTDSEKLEWFRTINIAGEKLTEQELRNAVYAGPWLADAKRHFSKGGCAAYNIGSKYVTGSPIRQDYLETALDWINGGDVVGYMAKHQHKPNANELWLYFQRVIAWVATTFPQYRSEMKGVAWGVLYNEFSAAEWDSVKIGHQVSALMVDEDVSKKKGIYPYVLNKQEKHLNIRMFSPNQRREAYERQRGKCSVCQGSFAIDAMEADHITPWHAGGKTEAKNCQMLCRDDNRWKGGV